MHKKFTTAKFHQIPRNENTEANSLARVALTDDFVDNPTKVQYIPCIDVPEVQQIDREANWTTPIMSYLKDGLLPLDKEETQKLRFKATKFVLLDDVLYKRSFSQPYLRCLTSNESNYVMRDVHEMACGNHLGAKSFIQKVVRIRYYWPSIQVDTKSFIQACNKCQRNNNVPRRLLEHLTSMTAPWLFAQQGLDILGPFPTRTRQMKFLVVGITYFTKWVKAKPLAKITEKSIKFFVWKNIVYHFRIPRVLVLDDG